MDATLVIVTVLSMGMAAALSAIVWRLLREERRRSEARVAALREAASLPVDRTAARATASDLPLRLADDQPVVTSALFVEAEPSSAWGRRFAIMAGITLLGGAAVLFAMTAGRRQPPVAARVDAAAAQPAPPPSSGTLELLSLRDEHRDGTLTITGLVHNPRTSPPLSRVTVTAYAFDGSGAFLASGHALLDVTSLSPGDDSPFVVTVPASDAVARYRIGFRGEDGRVIGHVDRRQQGPVAALRLHARDHS
jgi:hypothetical protein